ncbi:YbhB/YbcL family Raf kinase inhibitor-like protein [Raineyella sp. LH-20]|uniref:YbhB/YbcL family Raf kinase inhibitor-like protein n=1 Tax=Raineyella sp. LH-20 TaxID=3081204 RepID=UPI002952DBBF|nr:YbhB/YbcL family Raf kinase inhibitor-like protein [Raineyella sp. LH-20]WOP19572.1 YbhB/YbcL family Raf kinase inhibitor-like protein [Raineyella sp. LH-20]
MENSPFAKLRDLPRFALTSTDVADGVELAPRHRSRVMEIPGGEDVSPQLRWSGFPEGTRSFALTCYDPDAPTQSGWWHWAVFDIPVDCTELATGAGSPTAPGFPEGALTLRNDAGMAGFLGAAPPQGHGPHRYFFIVHAVDVEHLGLSLDTTPAKLGFTLFFHSLGRAWLTPTFGW